MPGQSYYRATRRLVLQGADGVVFVCDSQREQLGENLASLRDLYTILAEDSVDGRSFPLVLQYNKQDLPPEVVMTVPELDDALNFRDVPAVTANALRGVGVLETLRAVTELVLRRLSAGGSGGR